MEYDLLFTLIDHREWKQLTEKGTFEPLSMKEDGVIYTYEGKNIEAVANTEFLEATKLFLLVIDPLRIHAPIKKVKKDSIELLEIKGTFSIDAIIDRIPVSKNKKGKFEINIKHFD